MLHEARSLLHFHDLRFFGLADFIDLLDMIVGQLLGFLLTFVQLILIDHLLFFQVAYHVVRIAPDIADRDARFFDTFVHLFHQIAPAFFGELRDDQADDLPIVAGRHPQIGFQDGLFDGADGRGSQGRMTSMRGSGTEVPASWISGVGTP